MSRASDIINRAVSRRQFMTGVGAGALVAAVLRTQKASAAFGPYARGGGASSAFNGFYPSGHYVPENQPMVVVAPRPVSELSAWSFYQFAYYDGTNQLQMRYPLGVLGGSFPYVYGFTGTVPPGVTIPQPYWIPGYTWAQMQALGYGYVYYTPPLGSAIGDVISWTVRCYSQDYQTDSSKYIDIPMTVTLAGAYNSTSETGYVFMSTTGSDSNVNPTLAAPLATLTGVYSATTGTVQYPNGILVARGGTYAMLAQSGTALAPAGGVNCASIMAYPGETPIFQLSTSMTNGAIIQLGTSGSNCVDLTFQGIQFTGTTSASECHYFFSDVGLGNRCTFDSISAPNVWSGTNPTNNSSMIFYPDNSGIAEYVFVTNLSETNRPNNGSVQANIHVIYDTNYTLTQGCSATGQTSYNPPYGITYKAANSNLEMRCNTAPALGVSAQDTNGGPTNNVELRYNNLQTTHQYGIGLNGQNAASGSAYPLGATWSNRNSIDVPGATPGIWVLNTASITTIASVSDAIQYGTGSAITSATGITSSNTEAQGASGIFSTFPALSNSGLIGTRGSVIS